MIDKRDLIDAGIVDADELKSTASAADEFLAVSVTSVVSGVITVSGANLLIPDTAPESPDIFVLSGASAGNGSYTVDSVTGATTFTVNEAIVDSTGGSGSFRYPAGAKSVGVDPTNLIFTSETDLQAVLEDFDDNVGVALTPATHADLDTLLHNLAETHDLVPTFDAKGVMSSVVAQGAADIRVYDQLTKDTDGMIIGYRVRQYNGAGVVIETYTATVTISNGVPTGAEVVKT